MGLLLPVHSLFRGWRIPWRHRLVSGCRRRENADRPNARYCRPHHKLDTNRTCEICLRHYHVDGAVSASEVDQVTLCYAARTSPTVAGRNVRSTDSGALPPRTGLVLSFLRLSCSLVTLHR